MIALQMTVNARVGGKLRRVGEIIQADGALTVGLLESGFALPAGAEAREVWSEQHVKVPDWTRNWRERI